MRWLVGLCLLSLGMGCSSARYVVKEADGGIVSIPSNSNAWPFYHRREAEKLITSHFPDGYEIVREEEAVVGMTSSTNIQESRNPSVTRNPKFPGFETISTNATTSVQDKTEWRIYYRHKLGSNMPSFEGMQAKQSKTKGDTADQTNPTAIVPVSFEEKSNGLPLPDPIQP